MDPVSLQQTTWLTWQSMMNVRKLISERPCKMNSSFVFKEIKHPFKNEKLIICTIRISYLALVF